MLEEVEEGNADKRLYKTKEHEGFFAKTINQYLMQDDKKFQEFGRLNVA